MTDIERYELGNNVGAAYGFVGRNLGLIAILFAVWALVIGVVGFGGAVAIRLAIGAIPDLAAATAEFPEAALSLISLIPMVIASVVALSAVIVAWHRRIITGAVARNPFSVGLDPTLRYLACAIVVFGLAFAPLILAGAASVLLFPNLPILPVSPLS